MSLRWFIDSLPPIFCMVCGLGFYKNWNKVYWLLLAQVATYLIIDLMAFRVKNNTNYYTLEVFLEMVLLSLVMYDELRDKWGSRLIYTNLIVFGCFFCYVTFSSWEAQIKFTAISLYVGFTLITLLLLSIYQDFHNDKENKLTKLPWKVGVLVYFVVLLPYLVGVYLFDQGTYFEQKSIFIYLVVNAAKFRYALLFFSLVSFILLFKGKPSNTYQ